MRNCILTILSGLLAASASLAHGSAESFSFGRIVYSANPNSPIGDNFACDTNGNPLYEDKGLNGTNPVYKAQFGGSIPITVVGSNFAPTVQGPVSLNNQGDVSFQSFAPASPPVHGTFQRKAGGQVITLSGSSFGKVAGAPSMNQNGDVVFLSMDATGLPVINTRTAGGISGTIPDLGITSRLGRPAINTALNIVASGEFSDGQQGVVVQHVGGGFAGTIRGDWRLSSSQPRITENNKVVFAVEGNGGTTGIPTGRRSFIAATPTSSGGGFTFDTTIFANLSTDCDPFVNQSLSVACVDGEKFKLYLADGGNLPTANGETTWTEHVLLTLGDSFDGSTVTSIKLGDGSMLPDNSVMFHATLANGATGIYQIVVPEPTSMALFAGSLLLIRRRR